MTYINNVTDTLFADVSEFQVPVNDAYLDAGYKVLSIRANDGTYQDRHWYQNYPWCRQAVDSGRLNFFIVYCVWHPDWRSVFDTLKRLVGDPHPRMVVMIDVESWPGIYNFSGDNSDTINRLWWAIRDWLGGPRVIGYANKGDFNSLWPTRPDGLRVVGAGYGRNPNLPGQVAHQYTDGQGHGGGLPEGAPPFGNCDMNSADALSVDAFAQACGLGSVPHNDPPPPVTAPPTNPVPGLPLPALPLDRSLYSAAGVIAAQFLP